MDGIPVCHSLAKPMCEIGTSPMFVEQTPDFKKLKVSHLYSTFPQIFHRIMGALQ